MQDEINESLDNLSMEKTPERYLLTHLTITIKQLAETNKILTEKIKTLTATNLCLTSNDGHQKKSENATTGNDYESKLDPTGYLWMHRYKVVRGHIGAT